LRPKAKSQVDKLRGRDMAKKKGGIKFTILPLTPDLWRWEAGSELRKTAKLRGRGMAGERTIWGMHDQGSGAPAEPDDVWRQPTWNDVIVEAEKSRHGRIGRPQRI
jgi:hypothetical protein